jgi:hypothetical protein
LGHREAPSEELSSALSNSFLRLVQEKSCVSRTGTPTASNLANTLFVPFAFLLEEEKRNSCCHADLVSAIFLTTGEILMFRRFFAVMLSVTVLLTALGIQHAGAQTTGDQATEKVRAKVLKMGVGPNAKVEVKLRDNTQMRGYISEANQDSFTLFDKYSGANKTIAYADTQTVKKASGGISAKTWLILGGVAAGALITWIAVKPALCDGGAQTRGPC